LQNKLLEAMAMQIPCITSRLAFQALNATPGEDLMVAETPEEYIRHILFLLNNPEKAKEIGIKGRVFVHNNFSWENESAKIEMLLKK
jgi:glycosyltransferase involved in cell wall biosynthesis